MLFLRRNVLRGLTSPKSVLGPQVSARLKNTYSPILCPSRPNMHLRDGKEVQPTNSTPNPKTVSTETMAYTNCKTRIIDLSPLKLPQDPKTSDSTLCEIYRDYIDTYGSHSSSTKPATHRPACSSNHNKSHRSEIVKIEQADFLASAILSLKTGIAPPVAFPTETVYGLGADATNSASVAGIFAAKGRPSDNPLIVHVSSTDHLERCLGGTEEHSAIPEVYRDLISEFWPGPLTVLIPVPEEGKGVKFAPNVHPGQNTIGFRIPSSPCARFLLAVTDKPIAAPSANSSGKPSPTTAQHVKDDLDGKINFILDGGSCDVGVESTVVDGLGGTPLILRPGGLSKSALRGWGKKKGNVWQHVENGWESTKTGVKRRAISKQTNGEPHLKVQKVVNGDNGITNGEGDDAVIPDENLSEYGEEVRDTAAPRAPGMKYKHYAPKARMFLFESSASAGSGTNMRPVYQKLEELLAARDTRPNHECGHILRDQNAPLENAEMVRGPTHRLTIGILRSTGWDSFAKHLKEDFVRGQYPGWKPSMQPSVDMSSVHEMNITIQIRIQREKDHYMERQLNLETIDLGHDSATISRNLFAALRTCDDVGCDWIFAEAPSWTALKHGSDGNGATLGTGADEDDFETVLERLRKAATEIVYC